MTLCPGLPRSASARKVKPIWTLLKQETVSGDGISWAICKSAHRSRRITMPAPHHSVFYRLDALPATQPTVSKHWRHASFWAHIKMASLIISYIELSSSYSHQSQPTITPIKNIATKQATLVRCYGAESNSALVDVWCPQIRFRRRAGATRCVWSATVKRFWLAVRVRKTCCAKMPSGTSTCVCILSILFHLSAAKCCEFPDIQLVKCIEQRMKKLHT